MQRSDKPKIKREQVKVVLDEDAETQKKYLGFALKDIDQQVAEQFHNNAH
jgi:hypothetical protein